jgi:large subunit ribosomal protein L28
MSRHCDLTDTHTRFGKNVSHSNRRTQRRFLPNLQRVSFFSDALGVRVPMRVTTRAIRSVQKLGGIDAFLVKADEAKLPPEGARLRRRVIKALAGKRKAATAG